MVRHALAGLGEQLGMDGAALADLKTVTTEAAMNVVVHAYPESEPGPLEVEARAEQDVLTVTVRDSGMGIRPRPDVERPSLRIGLTLVAALSSSFEICGGAGRGTEIRMRLPLSSADGDGDGAWRGEPAPEQTEVRVSSPELVASVLSRVVAVLVARREIGVDRLADAMLLSDAISAAAPRGFANGQVDFSIADRDEGVVLRVGPMAEGGAERLREGLAVPEVGSLERLADELRVERGADGEFLVVAIDALGG